MSFTQQDLNDLPWDFIQKITFLKRELIITFQSGNGISAKTKDNQDYLQFYQEAKNRLKEEQIEIGDLPDEPFEKTK